MADYNSQMYKLLKDMKNRKFWKEIPRLEDLYYYLELWLEKFEALKDREDVCIIYVGVEDVRPFPTEIEDDVKAQIGHLQIASLI
jgi:hypothetical protein